MLSFALLLELLLAVNGISFKSKIIDSKFDSGALWLIAGVFDDSNATTIITLSMAGPIKWYQASGISSTIATIPQAVNHVMADINGDGYQDIVIGYKFGDCPTNCKAADGMVGWLENPKGKVGVEWKLHQLPKPLNVPHRVAVVGTGSNLVIVSIPITGVGADAKDPFLSPFVITYYKKSENFEKQYILSRDYRLCHDAIGSGNSLTISCFQGTFLLEWNGDKFGPAQELIPAVQFNKSSKYTGISTMDVLEPNIYPFISPYHGGNVGIKSHQGVQLISSFGDDVGHDLKVLDEKTFAVGFRSGNPGIRVFHLNQSNQFEHEIIYTGPISGMAVADFNGDGKMDIASINWGTLNDSSVLVHTRI